jgi:hypothetical protein
VLFCTIINVQGRQSRFRSADDLDPPNMKVFTRSNPAWSALNSGAIAVRGCRWKIHLFFIRAISAKAWSSFRTIGACSAAECRCSKRSRMIRTAGLIPIAPPQADEFESLDLYHATSGGEAELARTRRNEALIAGVNVTARVLDLA